MSGTLYLLRSNADASLHKIGITGNWPQRAKQLEVGLSTACVGRWTVNDNRQLEQFLHRRFKPHRLPQSEWFHLSADQVQWVISAASKAADDLKQATSHQQASQPPRPAAHTTYRHPAQPAPAAAKPEQRKQQPKASPVFMSNWRVWFLAITAIAWIGILQQVPRNLDAEDPPLLNTVAVLAMLPTSLACAGFISFFPSLLAAAFTTAISGDDD